MTALHGDGREREQRKLCMDQIRGLSNFRKISKSAKMAMEAVFNWYCALNVLAPLGSALHLVHPQKTNAIASARFDRDKLDLQILVRLLQARFITEAWKIARGTSG